MPQSIPEWSRTDERLCDDDEISASQSQELSVLIIILAFRLSWTRSPRLVKTLLMVSTTLWKLLAAPFSCVNRTMLRWFRLPCSMTVMISTAKLTSLMLRTAPKVSQSFIQKLTSRDGRVPV